MKKRDNRTGHKRELGLHCTGKEGERATDEAPPGASELTAPFESHRELTEQRGGDLFWILGGKKRTNLSGNNKAHFKTATGPFLCPSPCTAHSVFPALSRYCCRPPGETLNADPELRWRVSAGRIAGHSQSANWSDWFVRGVCWGYLLKAPFKKVTSESILTVIV